MSLSAFSFFFFFNDTATTEIYTLSLHDALPISILRPRFLVMSLGEGPLLTVGHGLDPTPIDAVADDVLLGRRRAPVAERQVVFVGPALVAMAADPNPQARVSLEDRHLLIQDRGEIGRAHV